jgi:AcrR family transcriptional regulator
MGSANALIPVYTFDDNIVTYSGDRMAGTGSASSRSIAAKKVRRRSPESQEALRGEMVECAKAIYRKQGYEAVSVRAVTEACGMSPMSFYGYFTSKQDLIRHIWIEFFSELLDRLLAAGRGRRSPLKVIEAHADAYLTYWETHPEHYRMVYLPEGLPQDAAPVDFNGGPVYQRMVALTRERVLACVHGRPIAEKSLRMAMDLLFVKALGYLHATLAVQRYVLVDQARLRRAVIKDMVETAAHADTPP